MTASTTRSNLGRHVFGVAAFVLGLIMVTGHNYKDWHQLRYVVYAAAQIFGGAAVQFRQTAKIGALVLTAVYLVFALLCVPEIIAKPLVYISWGDFFEELSLFTGPVIVYLGLSPAVSWEARDRIGRILLGLCTASFGLEQAFYLSYTASLVPKWIPPSQMFWAVTTTVFFALAAIALLANRMALLATRLLTTMLAGFGLLVWVPRLISNPHSHGNWSETAETFAIAGTAWILADLLGEYRLNDRGQNA